MIASESMRHSWVQDQLTGMLEVLLMDNTDVIIDVIQTDPQLIDFTDIKMITISHEFNHQLD